MWWEGDWFLSWLPLPSVAACYQYKHKITESNDPLSEEFQHVRIGNWQVQLQVQVYHLLAEIKCKYHISAYQAVGAVASGKKVLWSQLET